MSLKQSEKPSSSDHAILPIPLFDSIARFTLLYFTTLFSLDSWTAALNSPFSLPSSDVAEAEARRRGGRSSNVSYRLDPGGDTTNRRGGFGGGGSGRSLNATPCPSCTQPNVEIHQ